METRRWLNPTQPQTLQIAVFLLYFDAAFTLLFGLGGALLIALLFAGGLAGGGYGIANDRKWGYALAIAMAVLQVLGDLGFGWFGARGNLISLMFDVALVVLLLHPQSRDYQRIWFK